MKKFRLILLVVSTLAVFAGLSGAHMASTNPEPTDITLAEHASIEDFTWVNLQGATASLADAVVRKSSSGDLKAAYVPLYATEDTEGPVLALLETDSEEVMSILREMEPLADDLVALVTFYKENRDRLVLQRDFSGMAQSLGSISSEDRERLLGAEEDLVENAMILDDGSAPSMSGSITIAVLGLLGLVAWYRGRRKAKKAQTDLRAAIEAAAVSAS